MCVEQGIEFSQLLFQLALTGGREFAQCRHGRVFATTGLGRQQADQVLPGLHQRGEVVLPCSGHRISWRLQFRTVVGEHSGIDAIGLGKQAAGAGEVTGLPGIEHGDGEAGLLECAD